MLCLSMKRPGPEWMRELLEHAGIRLNPTQLDQLWRYHTLLRARNKDRDLTRIVDFQQMVVKHYVDCMYVGKLMKLPSPLLDVGSGAGFPGIPIKIRYPHLQVTLAEPRPRRVEFLREAVEALGLQRTDVFEHKVVSRSFTTPMAGVITRALETMDKTILRTSGCTPAGSKLIFMKGPSAQPELDEAMKRFGSQLRVVQDEHYRLPGTPHQRRLIVLERVASG
jgi:16S rRNA (guanine527-N7)-methyltransferase